MQLGQGLTSIVIQTRQPLVIGTAAESDAHGAITAGDYPTESWLGVPILAGDRVLGVMALESLQKNAYSEADARLLTTFSTSMGVALENARLFDETKRLLAETDQRAAELAIINGVQQGLAAELDMQAMYDLVGDKIHEIFDAQVVDIGILDRNDGLMHFPYTIERGVRFPDEPFAPMGFRKHVMATGEALLIDDIERQAPLYDQTLAPVQGEPAKSLIVVPLMVGGQPTGNISLQNLDRSDAFTAADSGPPDDDRSKPERGPRERPPHRRDLARRNAELAIINGVQQGLAAELDMQAMYDLVGDKIQEIFDAQVVDIGIYDRDAGLIHFPYAIERGVRFPDEPMPLIGFRSHVFETGQPLLVNRDVAERALALGGRGVVQGEPPKSVLFAPLLAGGEASGVISLQNLDREDAFSQSDQDLLGHARRQPQRGPRERPPDR